MISSETIASLEGDDCSIPYILGARMRRVKEVSETVLSHPGRYHDVFPEGSHRDPSPLTVKKVFVDDRRYIVCRNDKQARKDAAAREAMVASLAERLKSNPKGLVGNRGYARYLKVYRGGMAIDHKKIEAESRFDGKWVLRTNMASLTATQVACKYKELDRRLERAGHQFEWVNIMRDLKALQNVPVEESGRSLLVRTTAVGCCGKVFQAVGVAMPLSIREV
jgi:hypothetical protein